MRTASLKDLQAEIAIRRVLSIYTHAIDRRRWELMEVVFHEDAEILFGAIDGGWRHFVDHASRLLAPLGATHHQIGNQLIAVDGEVAHSETYVTAYHHVPVTTPRDHSIPGRDHPYAVIVGARYIDRFELRDGDWRIARRNGLYAWRTDGPVDDGGLSGHPAEWMGRDGGDDPAAAVADRILGDTLRRKGSAAVLGDDDDR